MTDDKKLDDIILFPGSKQELCEVMDANVRIMSPNIVRLLPKVEIIPEQGGFRNYKRAHPIYSSILNAEKNFCRMLADEEFSGVIHYDLLMQVVAKIVDGLQFMASTSYGCQGIPVIITPRTYRT